MCSILLILINSFLNFSQTLLYPIKSFPHLIKVLFKVSICWFIRLIIQGNFQLMPPLLSWASFSPSCLFGPLVFFFLKRKKTIIYNFGVGFTSTSLSNIVIAKGEKMLRTFESNLHNFECYYYFCQH